LIKWKAIRLHISLALDTIALDTMTKTAPACTVSLAAALLSVLRDA